MNSAMKIKIADIDIFYLAYDEPNKQQQLMSCISIERETKPKKKWVASLVSCVMEVEDQVKNTVEEN